MVEGGRLMWFSPDPRGLLPVDDRLHVPRRLARTIRSGRFTCTVNSCFEQVLRQCAKRLGNPPTWISPEIFLAYDRLHHMGLAHSVEAWPAGEAGREAPVGGVYGVAIGGAFFAESMFHTVANAGKAALVFLMERLKDRGFILCDIQWATDNLRRYGAFDLPRSQYLVQLARAVELDRQFV